MMATPRCRIMGNAHRYPPRPLPLLRPHSDIITLSRPAKLALVAVRAPPQLHLSQSLSTQPQHSLSTLDTSIPPLSLARSLVTPYHVALATCGVSLHWFSRRPSITHDLSRLQNTHLRTSSSQQSTAYPIPTHINKLYGLPEFLRTLRVVVSPPDDSRDPHGSFTGPRMRFERSPHRVIWKQTQSQP